VRDYLLLTITGGANGRARGRLRAVSWVSGWASDQDRIRLGKGALERVGGMYRPRARYRRRTVMRRCTTTLLLATALYGLPSLVHHLWMLARQEPLQVLDAVVGRVVPGREHRSGDQAHGRAEAPHAQRGAQDHQARRHERR